MWVQIVTGAFGLGGVMGGAILTSFLSRRADQRRVQAEDERRWLSDRRHAYAALLAIVTAMQESLEAASMFLSNRTGGPLPEDDATMLQEDVTKIGKRWDQELQPALSEVQLLAGKDVAELADRTSLALITFIVYLDTEAERRVEKSGDLPEYSNGTHKLIDALRNAMRQELGVPGLVKTFPASEPPWLEDDA